MLGLRHRRRAGGQPGCRRLRAHAKINRRQRCSDEPLRSFPLSSAIFRQKKSAPIGAICGFFPLVSVRFHQKNLSGPRSLRGSCSPPIPHGVYPLRREWSLPAAAGIPRSVLALPNSTRQPRWRCRKRGRFKSKIGRGGKFNQIQPPSLLLESSNDRTRHVARAISLVTVP